MDQSRGNNSQDTQQVLEDLKSHTDEQLKKFGSPSRKHKLSRSESLAIGAQPYLVFVTNTTGVDLNGVIFFLQNTNPHPVLNVVLPVPNGAQTGFQLGGPTDCNLLAAYRLGIYDQDNALVGDTGVVDPHQNPATPCVDAYVITQ